MAYFERMRDVVSEAFSPDVIQQRRGAGWQMVAIEWRRELPDTEAPTEGCFNEEIPYGLRVSDDCKRLEVEPREHQALLLMMELLVQDFSYSSIVSDLNEKGFRQRDERPWTRVAVFNMMPRLIEVGPRMFSSEEWERRRQRLAQSHRPE
ncbi:MAG TPA: recombinase family protein [Terracidiphilus sp.]